MVTLGGAAARGSAVTLVGQLVRFLIQFASVAVLARLLAPADFGLFSMVMALVGIATLLGDFGLGMASVQAPQLDRRQASNLFWVNTACGMVLAAAVFAIAPAIASFYRAPDLAPIAQATSFVFLVSAMSAQPRAQLSRELKFVSLAVADVTAQALGLGAAVALALMGSGVWAIVAQQLCVATSTLVIATAASRWLPGRPGRAEMRGLLVFGANTTGVQLVNYITSNLDSVLIGRFWGPATLGFYDRAYQLFRMPLVQLAAPLTRVALPVLSRVAVTDAFSHYVAQMLRLVSYVLSGLFVVLSVFATPVVLLMLGPGWEESVPLLRLLAVGGAIQALGYVYYWVFLATGKTGLQLRYALVTRAAMVVMLLLAAPFGVTAVAVAVLIGLLVNWLVLTLFAIPRTGLGRRFLMSVLWRPVVCSVSVLITGTAASFLVPVEQNGVWIHVVVLALVCCIVLGACLAFRGYRADVAHMIASLRLIVRRYE